LDADRTLASRGEKDYYSLDYVSIRVQAKGKAAFRFIRRFLLSVFVWWPINDFLCDEVKPMSKKNLFLFSHFVLARC
jgi:hypothetical protein